MSQGRGQERSPSVRGNGTTSNSESVRQPTWIGASGRLYYDPPPLVGMRFNEPPPPLSENPPQQARIALPFSNIVDQAIRLVANLPMPQLTPRDPNAVLTAQPICVIMRIFTGNTNGNDIREWTEHVQLQNTLTYEVTGYLHGIGMINPDYPAAPGNEINLLLRDRGGTGPILQVIHPHYLISELPRDIQTGQLIKCVGRFLDAHRMVAIKIVIMR